MSRGQRSSSSKPWQIMEVDPGEIHFEDFPGQPYSLNETRFDNFVVDHEEHGLIGSGDLYPREGYAHLRGAMIEPDFRGMKHGDSSPFGDLIERRIEEAGDAECQTDATTRHGKTQYKFEQFGFHPLGLEPHVTLDEAPLVSMWEGDRIENPEIFATPGVKDFIDEVLEPVIGNVDYGGAGRGGFSVGKVDFPESYDLDYITVGGGELSVSEAVGEILGAENRDSYASQAVLNLKNPANQQLMDGLLEEGYVPVGVEPQLENSRHYPHPEIHMVKLRSELEDLYLTDRGLEVIEKTGIDYSIEREDKSYRTVLEPTV